MESIVICRAEPQDAAALTQIALAAKRYWGYPGRWLDAWQAELTLTAEYIAANLVFIACQGDPAVGFYSLTFTAQAAELDHLWVLPGFIGQGTGRLLWEHAAVQAARGGAQRLAVVSDPNATEFYRKMGMTPAGESAYSLEGELRSLPRLEVSL